MSLNLAGCSLGEPPRACARGCRTPYPTRPRASARPPRPTAAVSEADGGDAVVLLEVELDQLLPGSWRRASPAVAAAFHAAPAPDGTLSEDDGHSWVRTGDLSRVMTTLGSSAL